MLVLVWTTQKHSILLQNKHCKPLDNDSHKQIPNIKRVCIAWYHGDRSSDGAQDQDTFRSTPKIFRAD